MKLSRFLRRISSRADGGTQTKDGNENDELKNTVPVTEDYKTRPPILLQLDKCQYKLTPFKQGGICDVYKGTPETDDQPTIAVKMIRKEWYTNSRVRRQFSTESQIVRDLQEKHLPHYISRGLINGKPYYAYEFIEGFRLINLSQKQDIFPPELIKDISLDITKQLLHSLHYMHTTLNPIAHGDISSENIIFDDWHNIHLIDFGCAHFLKMVDRNAYQWVGKPSFISPEQARGEAWDQRSDIYQAGILFYELTMGARWNVGTDSRSKTLYAASAEPPSRDFLASEVGLDISAVIAKMLHPRPQSRYQSAKAVLKDMGN
ncbi:MAG: serine/threonine protein kinase [Pseudomonadales bacterium]|nr:serine/threonine protein kinase [Pseudomonadales bacterium]